jgi:hypothetical protein
MPPAALPPLVLVFGLLLQKLSGYGSLLQRDQPPATEVFCRRARVEIGSGEGTNVCRPRLKTRAP